MRAAQRRAFFRGDKFAEFGLSAEIQRRLDQERESQRQPFDPAAPASDWMNWNLSVAIGYMMMAAPVTFAVITLALVMSRISKAWAPVVTGAGVLAIMFYAAGIFIAGCRYVSAWRCKSNSRASARLKKRMQSRAADVGFQWLIATLAGIMAGFAYTK